MALHMNQVLALYRADPTSDWHYDGLWITKRAPDDFFLKYPEGEYVVVPLSELAKYAVSKPPIVEGGQVFCHLLNLEGTVRKIEGDRAQVWWADDELSWEPLDSLVSTSPPTSRDGSS